MLHGFEAFPDGEVDVLGGDVVLEIDEGADPGGVPVGRHEAHRQETAPGRRRPEAAGCSAAGCFVSCSEALFQAGGEVVGALRGAGGALGLRRPPGHEGVEGRIEA